MKRFLSLIVVIALACGVLLGACSTSKKSQEDVQEKVPQTLKIGTIAGPTGMGMAKMINDGNTSYNFEIFTSPDTIKAAFISGDLDIAAVPITVAAALILNTEDFCSIACINTLGVLYIVENGDTIQSVQDLEGQTIYTISQGSTTEYILNYVLEKNGIKNAEVVYKTEAAEVISLMVAGKISVAMLPEPNVTVLKTKSSDVRTALDMTKEWDAVSDNSAVQGCIIVSKDTIQNKKEVLDEFLDDYKESVEFVNNNQDEAADMIVNAGLLPAKPIALKAIPNSNIVFIEGQEMKDIINAFLKELSTVSTNHANWSTFDQYAEENNGYYTR